MNDELKDGEKLMYFKDGMLDENPSYIFEKAIELYNEGKKEESLKLMEKIKDNLDFLVERNLEKSNQFHSKMSKRSLINTLVKIIIDMECEECFFSLAKRIYKGLEISLAVSRNLNNKKMMEWIKDMLKSEFTIEALHILKDIETEKQEAFLEEIMRIAKEEVETPQYLALEILSSFTDREEIKNLFINFVSDWDKEVRRISIMALSKYGKEEKVREALEEALEDERDESLKFSIKTILGGNNE